MPQQRYLESGKLCSRIPERGLLPATTKVHTRILMRVLEIRMVDVSFGDFSDGLEDHDDEDATTFPQAERDSGSQTTAATLSLVH